MIEFILISLFDIIYFIFKRYRVIFCYNGVFWVYIDFVLCFFIIVYSFRVLKFLFRLFVIFFWVKLVNILLRKLGFLGKG